MVLPFFFRFFTAGHLPVLKKLRLSVLCPVLNIADPFQGCPVFGRRGVVNLLEAANEGPAVRKSAFHGYLQQGKVRVDQQLIGVVHPGSGQMFLECGAMHVLNILDKWSLDMWNSSDRLSREISSL